MQQKFRVERVQQHGDWDEGTDPTIAWKELVDQGHDPDADYCVGYAEQGVAGVVFRGNLLECLTEASRRSSEGYFLVFPASNVDEGEKVEVH